MDPVIESRLRESFARQAFLIGMGGSIAALAPGVCTLRLPFRPDLAQQHGFFHAGALATLGDTAAGYAALTLMPPEAGVLTAEFKINLLRPGRGAAALARATVLKPGRTLTVARTDVFAVAEDGSEALCATLLVTLVAVLGRADVPAG